LDKIVGFIIIVALAIFFAVWAAALLGTLFAFAFYFLARASRPAIRQSNVFVVIGMAIGWGAVGTLILVFSSWLIGELVFGGMSGGEFWIDAANFGVILAITVFLGNRIALAPFARKFLQVVQPILVFTITVGVTVVFDIQFRGQSLQSLQAMNWTDLSNFSAYAYVETLQVAANEIPTIYQTLPQRVTDAYRGSSGSAFSLLPFMSLLLVLWSVFGFVRSFWANSPTPIEADDDSFKICISIFAGTSAVLILGALLGSYITDWINHGMKTETNALLGILYGLLSMVGFIISIATILIAPLVVTYTFVLASLSPTTKFAATFNRYVEAG